MITLVKVNLLTDDESVPGEIREKLTELLRDLIRDDPEGEAHARVSLEWKHTVHNRDYMATLPATAHVERVTLPVPKRTASKGAQSHAVLQRSSHQRRQARTAAERAR
jgi:hypothetical protein